MEKSLSFIFLGKLKTPRDMELSFDTNFVSINADSTHGLPDFNNKAPENSCFAFVDSCCITRSKFYHEWKELVQFQVLLFNV